MNFSSSQNESDCLDTAENKEDDRPKGVEKLPAVNKNTVELEESTKTVSDSITCLDKNKEINKTNCFNIKDFYESFCTNHNLIEEGEDLKGDIVRTTDNKLHLKTRKDENKSGDQYILAEIPNDAYVFLTLPKRLLTKRSSQSNEDNTNDSDNLSLKVSTGNNNAITRVSKKKEKKTVSSNTENKIDKVNKNALRILLFENLSKSDKSEMPLDTTSRVSSGTQEEVDSAISFSCITTPEVVASSNITSTSQSAVAVDTKPLQLESCYRAVASLTGTASVWSQRRAGPQQRTASPPSHSRIATKEEQPRSVVSSSINGLPLLRSSYGATAAIATAPASATAPPDEHKKSLDENGNSVQTYSSPQSGSSSQHKKPRRKKSSKNETVINLHQIDGYQGNKDVNELMRFIEPESGRTNKLGRSKHKDDSDHKDKKRSTERRKDKENKVKRATSLEELSRTTLADLTDKPTPAAPPRRANAAAKPERRSWGDDARHAFYFREQELAPDVEAELTDFQTVTKKRRSRRRTDEPVPRRAAAPSPRAVRRSAPPSDRSNDSNDDMDSVHSLPADAPPARPPAHPPHASYADIARTRHNIPDLIESCNFYIEGDSRTAPRTEETGPPAPSDTDGYPALEPRGGARRPRDGKPGSGNTCVGRRERKEQPEAAQPTVECPAPDVVADRRPAVILLDAGAHPRDMDGVTFGFDINEQLLQPARRARCDLLCEALEAGTGSTTSAVGDGVAVVTGCGTVRYLPPAPLHDSRHLNQIIDYIGNAWDDVMRCGAGKVRYFNE